MTESRTPHSDVEATFQTWRATKTDINEHLDLLWQLASECEHVTEFGLRHANGSTIAFLAAQPKTLISWDIDPYAIVNENVAKLLDKRGRTSFQPRVGNTLTISPIEPTELLFIDTYHTAKQLLAELERHADPVRNAVKRYLVFHDTTLCGMEGEDGSKPGLRGAIRFFQLNHAFPLWHLAEDKPNNNGLVVLRHA